MIDQQQQMTDCENCGLPKPWDSLHSCKECRIARGAAYRKANLLASVVLEASQAASREMAELAYTPSRLLHHKMHAVRAKLDRAIRTALDSTE